MHPIFGSCIVFIFRLRKRLGFTELYLSTLHNSLLQALVPTYIYHDHHGKRFPWITLKIPFGVASCSIHTANSFVRIVYVEYFPTLLKTSPVLGSRFLVWVHKYYEEFHTLRLANGKSSKQSGVFLFFKKKK